jgi:hypothetical protein
MYVMTSTISFGNLDIIKWLCSKKERQYEIFDNSSVNDALNNKHYDVAEWLKNNIPKFMETK